MNIINKEPKLGKPGAGVPFLERMVLRWYLGPFQAARSNWEEVDVSFQKLAAKMLKTFEGLTPEQMETRVLVPSQKGLEDSSRYWSVAMVLEHVALVGNYMKAIVLELSNGRVPPHRVDTALVKPTGKAGAAESAKAFRAFSETVVKDIQKGVGDRESRSTLRHPWFGPFTAKQWHWLLVGHMLVHYKQLKEIVSRSQKNASPAGFEPASPP